MAFNKNNKKIVTTALTAAMVASAVAPVAAAKVTPAQAATNAVKAFVGYKVTTKHEFNQAEKLRKAAVTALSKLGKNDAKVKASLTSQISAKYKANLAVYTNITKAEQAVATYKATKIVTVNSFKATGPVKYAAQKAVAALVNTGLKNSFNAQITAKYNELLAAHTEVVNVKAVEDALKLAEVTPITPETTKEQVELVFTQVTGLIAKVKDEAKKAAFTAKATELKEAALAKIAELAVPKVESVTAINAKQVEVKFSQSVDAKTLKDDLSLDVIKVSAGNGAVNPSTIIQSLSEDGKTLTLTAANYFKGDYTVAVPFEVVKGSNGKFVAPVNQAISVSDTAAPVLSSASATVKSTTDHVKLITLTFNEDVQTIDNVKINGINYVTSISGKTATVAVDLDSTKTYDITVVNAVDAAGNLKDVQTGTLNVTVDSVAPSIINVVATGENTLKVTVDKALDSDSLVITGKVGTYVTDVVASAAVNPENKKEYVVTLKDAYLFKNGNSDTVTLRVVKDLLKDTLGNTNAADIVKTVVVNKDAVAPTITNVENTVTAGKVTGFTVTYNEDVTSFDPTKVSVVNSKGEILSYATLVSSASISVTDAKKVVFTFVNGVAADKYGFDFAEGLVTDKSLAKNKAAKNAFVVDVTNAATPIETTFTITNATASSNAVTVDFGTKVKATGTGSALNPASYQVNGTVLPADTVINFVTNAGVVDQSKVVITLPAGFVKASDAKAIFRVNGVQTLDNKVNNSFIKEISVTDNTAPEAKSFVATELNKVTVTYSEALKALAVGADVTDEIQLFDSKGAQIAVTGSVVTADGKLVLTVGDSSLVNKLSTVTTDATVDIKDGSDIAQKVGVTVLK